MRCVIYLVALACGCGAAIAQVPASVLSLPTDTEMARIMRENKVRIDQTLTRKELQAPTTGYIDYDSKPSIATQATRPAPQPKTSVRSIGTLPDGVASAVDAREMERILGRTRQLDSGSRPPAQMSPDRLMLFVSLSMPEAVLREMSRQVAAVGGVVILRGMNGESLQDTTRRAALVNRDANAEWVIHPELFKQFKIDKVPAWVLAEGKGDLDGNGCSPPGDYAAVFGDVSAHVALNAMSARGPTGLRKRAVALLGRLEGRQR